MNKLSVFLFLLFANGLWGQSVDHYEKLALASFYTRDFPTALLYSEKIMQIDERHFSSLFVAGESARQLNELNKAEAYLEKIPEQAKAGYLAATDYHLGLVKQDLDKKDEAKNYFQNYLDKHEHENDLYAHLAQNAIRSLATGKKWEAANPSLDKLPDNINSDRADLAPLRYANKLYYSSVLLENYLPTKHKKKRWEQRPVTRIYEAQFNRESRESEVNPRSAILNASNVSLMPDASRMYYTLCSDENPLLQEHCTIWYRNRFYNGEWGPAVKLPEQINDRHYTNTQPTVGYDWALKKYVLYFVSNRPGGAGGKDIWCSEIERDGTFGEPYPISINTPGDEITPFFHQPSQTLFFSSEGWENKGGFDIFHAKKTAEKDWKAPVNMGSLLNTADDEFYYTFHTSSKFAYYVAGKRGKDWMNTDIFEARVFIDCQLRAFDNQSKTTVENASIEIVDLKSGANGKYNTGPSHHDLKIKLEPGTIYEVKVSANGFEPKTFQVDTESISYFTLLEKNVFLQPYARP